MEGKTITVETPTETTTILSTDDIKNDQFDESEMTPKQFKQSIQNFMPKALYFLYNVVLIIMSAVFGISGAVVLARSSESQVCVNIWVYLLCVTVFLFVDNIALGLFILFYKKNCVTNYVGFNIIYSLNFLMTFAGFIVYRTTCDDYELYLFFRGYVWVNFVFLVTLGSVMALIYLKNKRSKTHDVSAT